jgi:hypothetical protein
MSGTNGSVLSGTAGVGLPSPVVRLGGAPVTVEVADGSPVTNNTLSVSVLTQATVSAHGLPRFVLDDIDTYRPQLELMRYVGRRTRSVTFSRNFKNSGYVHPSDGVTSPSGSYTHGGGQPFTIGGFRQTAWPVSFHGEVFNVTQGVLAFMQVGSIQFRDATGTVNAVNTLHPAGVFMNVNRGKRYPYDGKHKPGYFAFRWSVIDPSDDRGQRVTGPLSSVISCTNEVFPFIPDVSLADGRATASIAAQFDERVARLFVGSVSRLPR